MSEPAKLDAVEVLARLGTLHIEAGETDSVLGEVLDAAVTLSDADFGTIQLVRSEPGSLRLAAQRGFPAWWLDYWAEAGDPDKGCGTALQSRTRIIVPDVEHSPFFVGTPALGIQLKAGVRALQCTPLIGRGGEPIGILATHYRAPREPDESTLRLLDLVARQASDILEQARAQECLRRERDLNAAIVNTAGALVIVVDASGRLVRFNRSSELVSGCSAAELVGRPFFDLGLIPPEQVAGARVAWEALVGGTSPDVHENEWVAKDGTRHLIAWSNTAVRDQDGNVTLIIGTGVDITERRRAERTMAAAHDRASHAAAQLTTAIESLEFPFIIFDATGRPVELNAAARVMFGIPSDGLTSETWNEVLIGKRAASDASGRRLELHELPMPRALLGERVQHQVVRVRSAAGAPVVLEASAVPLRVEGRVVGAVVAYHDVSERERVEGELRDFSQRKDEFLAMLSHELRNPLAPIRNSLYILEHAEPGGEQARRAVAVLDRQVGHLTRLVNDLLDLTRISHGRIQLHRERVELNELARRTAEDQGSVFAASGVMLELQLAPGDLWVYGDRTRLSQAIGNLLSNAAKFTPAGGQTTLTIEADPTRLVGTVRVRDTGVGIPSELVPRVFEPFTQAEKTLARSRGGLGLGLALVKGLVEQHGGSVAGESLGVDQGATFTIKLPLMSQPAAGVMPGPLRPGARPKRVLIIEDNPDAAQSLRDALVLEGHEVTVSYSGSEGLEAARTFQPDVVLCDVGLPDLDGYAVVRALHADPVLAHVPVVALTGYAQPEDLARARVAGFDAHLAKPSSVETIASTLDRLQRNSHESQPGA